MPPQRIALVTGCTAGGIGFELCKGLLLQPDIVVYVSCRTVAQSRRVCASLRDDRALPCTAGLLLDDLRSVREFTERGFPEASLNVLINNAGVMGLAESTPSEQAVESHVAVNYLGHWLLTELLLAKLKAGADVSGEPSRVVNVSSDAHLWVNRLDSIENDAFKPVKYDKDRAYGYSKLFQIWHAAEINKRQELKGKVIAFAVHPGVVATQIARNTFLASWSFTLLNAYAYFQPDTPWKPKTPEQGAAGALKCAIDELENLGITDVSFPKTNQVDAAFYYRDCKRVTRLSELVKDQAKSEELDRFTREFCQQQNKSAAKL